MTDRPELQSSRRVLVVHEGKNGPTATQMISFGQPFESRGGAPAYQISFETHLPDRGGIEKAFGDHGPHVLVLSRYTSELGLDWIRLSREAGIPVVFHIDDDLLAVPASLGEAKYKAYNSPERLRALRQNIEQSDLLYVSTSELARRFEDHGISTAIIPGSLYCSVRPDEIGALLPPASGPVIGYMGTSGHAADLAMVLPAICEVMDVVPGMQFEVFGTIKMPPQMERFGRRVRHIEAVGDYKQFLAHLRTLGWWIGLAPLEDNPFNRSKADTKWVEYSSAGIPVIASDLPLYERACADGAGILANSKEDWKRALLELVYRPDLRKRMVERAQARLHEAYTHECLRSQVTEIFSRALAMKQQATG